MYTKAEFKSLKNSPFNVPEGKLMVDTYGILARVKSFTTPADLDPDGNNVDVWRPDKNDIDKMLRLVVLMYEPVGNPLIKEKDPVVRADFAWSLLGVKKSAFIRKRQEESHPYFRHILVTYLKLTCNSLYAVWATMNDQIYMVINMLQTPVSLTDITEKDLAARQRLSDSLPELLEKVASIEKRLFPDSIAQQAAVIEEVSGTFWAEMYALDFN